ncbi:hypothetical protein BE15_12430 [Sorangium cellulosum]|uniref:Uncharacterized protein n=1 Tax=Sorangium cellulosum TaxID=56 RepID=A0A150Q7E6_SORCE|nr:hypothetical protein BE15_12430 [Sorangium cellulosum]
MLIDESVGYGRAARDPTQLMWAEQRLSALGFQVVAEGRIKSYTQSDKGFVVYADPRAEGEISFRVYWMPQPKKFGRRYAQFSLKDAWKHDLVTKYKTRLVAALSQQ